EPDVGVALDPEWAVSPGEVPGEVYGSTTGQELDDAAAYLSSLVHQHDLPEKVMVFHQVHASVVRDEGKLRRHPGVVPIKSVDGIGARSDKEDTWRTLMRRTTSDVHAGFKLFFDEDTHSGPLMTPDQVLSLTPTPVYVMYELVPRRPTVSRPRRRRPAGPGRLLRLHRHLPSCRPIRPRSRHRIRRSLH